MLIEAKGSPFIVKSLRFRRSPFLDTPKHCAVESHVHQDIHGFSVNLNTGKLLKAAIGEYLERLAAFKCLHKNTSSRPTFKAVSILNGTTIEIPASSVLLNYSLPIFNGVDESEKFHFFSDSCGTAAHLESERVIEKAYLEFIERQSFIHTWLAKRPGKRIPLESLQFDNEKVAKRIGFLKENLDNIQCFDISLVEDVKVILTIGYNSSVFSAGLSADWDLCKAVESSLNEFTMVLEGSIYNNHYLIDRRYESRNVYVAYFYSMKVEEFIESYEFLLTSSDKDVDSSISTFNNVGVFESIKNFNSKFNIQLYTIQFPVPISDTFVKIVKVVSPDVYPHMQTELFDPEDYAISTKMGDSVFPNKYKKIPFA